MALEHVALVSQTKRIPLKRLVVVAAALQKQVSRDFGLHWNVQATVDAFGDLHDVPLGYWHIIIRDDIPFDAAGIHLNEDNGQPFALVRYSTSWPLTVSHECLEMLADPFGNRIFAGNSIKKGQGRVEYLVEVCDPSEAPQFGYTVNGVLLSDFYTERFFDPVKSSGVRYSFTGAIRQPRQVLNGGYITWRDPVSTHVFQQFVQNGIKRIEDLGPLPSGFGSMRQFADRSSIEFRSGVMEGKPARATRAAATEEVSAIEPSHGAQAKSLDKQVAGLIATASVLADDGGARLSIRGKAPARARGKKAPAEVAT